ncbi:MAG: YceH family protein [Planctomycetes bacterium]|nr:YceH family protein [Planctomycetota bacterium]
MSADTTPTPSTTPTPAATPQPATKPSGPPPTVLITPPAPPPTWEPLLPLERRILGALVEKQKTSKSADSYPLSLNSLWTACNQKSNRDPVLDLSDDDVEQALPALQKKGLVIRITGGRVERFRHNLYDTWTRNGAEMAVLAELLLRGPQTKGDLRTRATRMDPIETLDALEVILKSLTARRLAVYLTEPDRRGAVVTHGFHTPEELARLKAHFAHAPASASLLETEPAVSPRSNVSSDAIANLEAKLAAAVGEIDTLKAKVASLENAVGDLRKQLGITPATA